MGFPSIQARATGRTGTSNVTSHQITLPANIQAGELLLVVFGCDGNQTIAIDTNASGTKWTLGTKGNYSSTVSSVFVWKIAEGNDALTLTTGAGEQSSHVSFRISGGYSVSGTSSNGTGTNSDPPNHAGHDGEQDYLWIATRAGDSTVVASAAPSNYGNLQTQAAADTSGASTNTAERQRTASSENPGTFTSDDEQWVCFTLAISPYQPPPTPSGGLYDDLISCWELDEASGNAQDSHGGYHMSPSNISYNQDGKIGKAMGFNGSSSKLYNTNCPNLNITSKGSISLWCYHNINNYYSGSMAGTFVEDWGYGYALYAAGTGTGGAIRASLHLGGNPQNYQVINGSSTLAKNTWYHIVATWDGSRVKLYVNGVKEADVAQTITVVKLTEESFAIGCNIDTQWNPIWYNGRLDQVAVWGEVLDADAIAKLYNDGDGLGYADFGEEGGTVADIEGAISCSSILSGTLIGKGAVSGSVTSQSSLTGTLKGKGAVSGSSTGQTSLAGTLKGKAKAIGSLLTNSLLAASLTGIALLSGAVTSTSTVSGSPQSIGNISGQVETQSIISATIKAEGRLQGAAECSSDITGTIKGAGRLAGEIHNATTLSAELKGNVYAQGSISSGASVTGALNADGKLLGNSQTGTSISGEIKATGRIEAGLLSESILTGLLTAQGKLTSEIISGTQVNGILSGAGTLQGEIYCHTIVSGSMEYSESSYLFGNISGASIVEGTLKATGPLNGIIQTGSLTEGRLSQKVNITGAIHSSTLLSANISATGKLAGELIGYSAIEGVLTYIGKLELSGEILCHSVTSGHLTAKEFFEILLLKSPISLSCQSESKINNQLISVSRINLDKSYTSRITTDIQSDSEITIVYIQKSLI